MANEVNMKNIDWLQHNLQLAFVRFVFDFNSLVMKKDIFIIELKKQAEVHICTKELIEIVDE